MSPLWGSRAHNGNEDREGEENREGGEQGRGSEDNRGRSREPDERTRLLPQGGAFLSPDDPAVSNVLLSSALTRTDHDRWLSLGVSL